MKTLLTYLFSLGSAVSVVGCGEQAPASAPAAQLAKPTHLYVMKDGEEYGYEMALSENDKKAGQAAVGLAMYQYLGRKGGTYQVMLREGNARMVFECTKPCEFGKIHTFAGASYLRKDILKLTPNAIVGAVVTDAMGGQLDQLIGKQNGKAVTYWVDGDSKRLIVADATTSGVVR